MCTPTARRGGRSATRLPTYPPPIPNLLLPRPYTGRGQNLRSLSSAAHLGTISSTPRVRPVATQRYTRPWPIGVREAAAPASKWRQARFVGIPSCTMHPPLPSALPKSTPRLLDRAHGTRLPHRSFVASSVEARGPLGIGVAHPARLAARPPCASFTPHVGLGRLYVLRPAAEQRSTLSLHSSVCVRPNRPSTQDAGARPGP